MYVTEGGIKVTKTYTQTLQKVHALKPTHGGSPVKVFSLKTAISQSMTQDHLIIGIWQATQMFSPMFGGHAQEVGERPTSHLFEPGN